MNQAGSNTITDTPARNPTSVMSMAGIEAAYADIKNLTIPVPELLSDSFSNKFTCESQLPEWRFCSVRITGS
jgi:hypothetical protein